MRHFLPKLGVKVIDQAIEALFARMKVRLFGKKVEPKVIRFEVTGYDKPIQYRPDLSIPKIVEASAQAEGFKPNSRLQSTMLESVEQYLDAHQELAKAKVKNAVQSVLSQAEAAKEEVNFVKVLNTELTQVMHKVNADVSQVVEGELNKARSLSTLDAIGKVNAMVGISDPTIVFIGPNDSYCCDDCKRLFFLKDGVTPRVWKMSEIKHGYAKHGDSVPSTCSHPHCRHFQSTMMPGFGFKGGKITYISPDYDVYKDQRL
jgi:hypothetical protein